MRLHRLTLTIAISLPWVFQAGWSQKAQAAPFGYVTNLFGDTVSVIDTASNMVTATVPVGHGPKGVAVSPDGARVYVVNFADSTLSIIDAATNHLEATVSNLVRPQQIAIDPSGRRAYITHSSIPGYVSVLDTETNGVIARIGVGDIPFGVAVSTDGAHAYVTNTYDASEQSSCQGDIVNCILTVSVIDTARMVETARVVVGTFPTGIAVSRTGDHVYVGVGRPLMAGLGTSLVVIDTTPINFVSNAFQVSGDLSVAVAPSGDPVYVAGGTYRISVVAADHPAVVTMIPTAGSAHAVAVTPNGRWLYVANQNEDTVSVVDAVAGTTIKTIEVGDGPTRIAIGPEAIGTTPTRTETARATFTQTASTPAPPTAIPVTQTPSPLRTIKPSGGDGCTMNRVQNPVDGIRMGPLTLLAVLILARLRRDAVQ